MTQSTRQPSLDDVLNAFAVEKNPGRETLERYLRGYPQYAEDLVDLSHELSRTYMDNEEQLPEKDRQLIDTAWRLHLAAASDEALADPFATLSVTELRKIAEQLGVPRQIVTAFRERRVIVDSVPRRFLLQLAAAVNSTVERLVIILALPPGSSFSRSYKADGKPAGDASATFEQILMDAGVSEQKLATLLEVND